LAVVLLGELGLQSAHHAADLLDPDIIEEAASQPQPSADGQ